MDDEPWGLVDDEELFVFVENFEWDVFGLGDIRRFFR